MFAKHFLHAQPYFESASTSAPLSDQRTAQTIFAHVPAFDTA